MGYRVTREPRPKDQPGHFVQMASRPMMAKPMQVAEFESMSKSQVRTLADSLLSNEHGAVETCVRFVCAETQNIWHGRGRAMMCRRLKHLPLTDDQTQRLVDGILHRLSAGRFSEQFRDQLRLALQLSREDTFTAARQLMSAEKPYLRRYAQWILLHEGGVEQDIAFMDGKSRN